MRVYPISIWFVCKSCGFTFILRNVDDILNHKKKMHLAELKKTQCIVFEEKRTEFIDDGEESDADTAPAIEVNDKDIVDEDEGNRSRISALNDDETEFKVCIEEGEPLSPSGSENNRTVVEQRSSGKQCPTRVPGAVTELQDVQSLELDISENVDPATHENENDSYVTCANEDPEIETTSIGFINDVDEGIQEFNLLNEQRSSDESDDGRDSPMEIDDDLGSPVPDSPELDSASDSQNTSQSQTHDLIQTGGQLTSEATATATSSNIELESEIPVPVSRNVISRAGLAKKSRKSRSRKYKKIRTANHWTENAFRCPYPNCPTLFKFYCHFVQHKKLSHESKEGSSNSNLNTKSVSNQDRIIDEVEEVSLVDWLRAERSQTGSLTEDSVTDSAAIDLAGNRNLILLEPDPNKVDVGPITTSNMIQCKLCCIKLTTEADVKLHVQSCWLQNKRLHRYCVICKRKFSQPWVFRNHSCVTKLFAKPGQYVVKQLPKPYVCKFKNCGISFISRGALSTHERFHSTSGSSEFQCSICEERFGTRLKLIQHGMVHNPYKCDYEGCTAAYRKKSKLRDHKRVHTGERPFTCKICGKTFTSSKYVSNHSNRVHKIPVSSLKKTNEEMEEFLIFA